MSDLALLILAAGGSSRMGRTKQLLSVAGEPLVHRSARSAVDSGCRPAIVVLGAEHEAIAPSLSDLDVTLIINPHWFRGIGTSIRTGTQALLDQPQPIEAMMILLADQPMISSAVIRRLRSEHERVGKPITVASFGDAIGPPVIVGRSFFAALLSLPDDQGAKSLWQRNPELVHRAACPEAQADIDTPDDYAQHLGPKS